MGAVSLSKTGNDVVDRNFASLMAIVNGLSAPTPFQAIRVTKDYQATGFEGAIHVDASRGPVRITMPAPSTFMPPLTIKQVNAAGNSNTVTVAAKGAAKTIAGSSSMDLGTTGTGSITLTSDGIQHWPETPSGGNPPAPSSNTSPSPVQKFFGQSPIFVKGDIIGIDLSGIGMVDSVLAEPPLYSSGGASPDITLQTDSTLAVVAGALGFRQSAASSLVGNPTGSPASVIDITLGAGLAFVGTTLVNTSPLSSLTATLPLQITGTDLEIRGAITTGGTSTSPTSLGALASGVLENVVLGGVSTPTVFSASSGRIPFGSGTNGGLTDSSELIFNVAAGELGITGGSGSNQAGLLINCTNSLTGCIYRLTNDINSAYQIQQNGSAFPGNPDTTMIQSHASHGIVTTANAISFATAALSTGANNGFLQLQSMPAVPVITPLTITPGQIPIVVDSVDNRLYAYNSGWKPYAQYTGGLATGIIKNTTSTGLWSIAVAGTDYQAPGNYITALTGDVTAAGPGSVAATIGANKVTYAKIQTVTAGRLLGNPTASTANVSEISIGSGLSLSVGGVLSATGSGGTVTSVSGTAPIAVATGTTTPVISLNIDATLAVVSGNLGRAAISGDGSIAAGSNTFSLSNIPTGTTAAGTVNFTQIAAPLAPAAGHTLIWSDSTNGGLWASDGSATSHTVQSAGPLASRWISAIHDNGTLTLTQPSYSDLSGSVPAITQLTGDVTAGPGSGSQVATIAGHAVTFGKFQQVAGLSVVGVSGAATADVAAITATANNQVLQEIGGALAFHSLDYSQLTGTPAAMTAGPGINIAGTQISLGSVSVPTAPTIAEFANVPPAAASAASMQAVYLWDLANITLTGTTHVTGNGLALASFAGPTITDSSAVTVDAASTLLVTGPPAAAGSVTLTKPFSFWVASGSTQLDGTLAVNGVTAPTNVSFIVGHSTESDRDRVQFFLGGGSQGPTGTGDSTLVDFLPSGTAIRSGVTAGIYATQRIRSLTYAGVSSPTITEAASLYIDDSPALSGATGAVYAIHVAGGTSLFRGDIVKRDSLSNVVFAADGNGVSVTSGYDFGATYGVLTNATGGFCWIPSTTGLPFGTPSQLGIRPGAAPMVYDHVNDRLFIWSTTANAWMQH